MSRRWMLAVAGVLFGLVFALRLSVEDPQHAVTLLYALPIALVAVERGRNWGLASAALALALFAIWDLSRSTEVDRSAIDYVTRGTAFFVLGGAVGALADRARRISDESSQFWELSSDMLCIAGFDGYFKRVNPAWEKTLGWSAEELCSRPYSEFVHPDDRDSTDTESESLTKPDYQTLHFENRYRTKSGEYRHLLWAAESVPDQGLIYATARDITESRLAQEELRTSERFLESVLENLPSMVFVKDAEELRFVRFNRAGEELIGSSRDELIGKRDHDLFPKEGGGLFRQERPRRARLGRGGGHSRGADRDPEERQPHPAHPQDRDPG